MTTLINQYLLRLTHTDEILMNSLAALNMGFAIAGVPCFTDTLVQGSTAVILLNFCAKNPLPSLSPNRYKQFMMHNPKHNITAKKALLILAEGLPLIDMIIDGDLEVNAGEDFGKALTIENCTVENLKCMMVQFLRPVRFKNCLFKDASFNFCYFLKGLTIEDCIFDKYLDFEAGGHNEPNNPVIFRNNEFKEFVNFCDCWYNGEIEFNNNKFNKGTNIESENQYLTFDMPINSGQTNIESECRE